MSRAQQKPLGRNLSRLCRKYSVNPAGLTRGEIECRISMRSQQDIPRRKPTTVKSKPTPRPRRVMMPI